MTRVAHPVPAAPVAPSGAHGRASPLTIASAPVARLAGLVAPFGMGSAPGSQSASRGESHPAGGAIAASPQAARHVPPRPLDWAASPAAKPPRATCVRHATVSSHACWGPASGHRAGCGRPCRTLPVGRALKIRDFVTQHAWRLIRDARGRRSWGAGLAAPPRPRGNPWPPPEAWLRGCRRDPLPGRWTGWRGAQARSAHRHRPRRHPPGRWEQAGARPGGPAVGRARRWTLARMWPWP